MKRSMCSRSDLVSNISSVDAVNVFASLSFGLLPVNEVQSPSLDLAVNESTCETGHDLLGFVVASRLA